MLKDVSPDERMKTLVLNEFCRSYGYIWKQQGNREESGWFTSLPMI